MDYFNQYRFIKKKLNFRHKGYDIDKLIAPDLIMYLFKLSNCNFHSFKSFVNALRSHFVIQDFQKYLTSSLLFTNTYKRPDYFALINAVRGRLSTSTEFMNIVTVKRRKTDIINIVSSLPVFFKLYNLPFRDQLFIYTLVVNKKNTIDWIEEYKSVIQTDLYIAFNSAWEFEVLLTLFFKKHKVPTFSLQHGMIVDYKKFTPLDSINWENFSSDYLLCWGASTRNFFKQKGYDNRQLIVVGHPQYKSEIGKVFQNFESCLVLLSRKLYDEDNIELLNIIKKVSLIKQFKISVKLHPSLDVEKYTKICNELHLDIVSQQIQLGELLNSKICDFTISFNTTAYYESLICGKLSFRFKMAENEIFMGLKDQFSTPESLLNLIEKYSSLPEDGLKNEINSLLTEIFAKEDRTYEDVLKVN